MLAASCGACLHALRPRSEVVLSRVEALRVAKGVRELPGRAGPCMLVRRLPSGGTRRQAGMEPPSHPRHLPHPPASARSAGPHCRCRRRRPARCPTPRPPPACACACMGGGAKVGEAISDAKAISDAVWEGARRAMQRASQRGVVSPLHKPHAEGPTHRHSRKTQPAPADGTAVTPPASAARARALRSLTWPLRPSRCATRPRSAFWPMKPRR